MTTCICDGPEHEYTPEWCGTGRGLNRKPITARNTGAAPVAGTGTPLERQLTPCGAIVCTGCRICGCAPLGILPAAERGARQVELTSERVQAAVDQARTGDITPEALEVIIAAAAQFATLNPEYGTAIREPDGTVWDHFPHLALTEQKTTIEQLRKEFEDDARDIVIVRRYQTTPWVVIPEPRTNQASGAQLADHQEAR